MTDALGRVTTYTYDSRGNRTKRIDALAGEREWHWNLADQLVKEIDPLERETTYTYDALGRLDVTTDGAGRTADHGYDAAGQLTSISYATGTPVTFQYDGEGRRTRMVDPTGTTQWYFNATGQMTGANLPGARDLAFAWDLAGRRTVITYPDGTRYRNRYDSDGRLSGVQFDDAGTWVDVAANTYDDDGLLVEQDQGTDGERTWTHDPLTGRVTGYAETRNGTTTATTLTHDAAGRIATENTGGVATIYDYDDAGQLTSVDRSVGDDETYAYDELGRRTTSTRGAVTTTYEWDAASQLTRRVVGGVNHNYQYDASGRRTREGWNGGTHAIQWFWNDRGTNTGQRYTEPGTITELGRSNRGDGTLARHTTHVDGVLTETTDVVWDPTLPVPQPVWTDDPGTTNSTRAVYGPDLIEVDCATGTGCTGPLHHDHLGSALETPATADVTQAPAYDAYGDGGPFATGTTYGYRSELHAGDTIHLRNRDYDPATGLFLSPDPLDGVDGTTTVNNPYHYADNDPLNTTDPTGLRPGDDEFDVDGGDLAWASALFAFTIVSPIWGDEVAAGANLGRVIAAGAAVAGGAVAGCAATDCLDRPGSSDDSDEHSGSRPTPSQPPRPAPPRPPTDLPTDSGQCSAPGDCELVPVWFGQRRISATYRGGSIQAPPSGVIRVFTDGRAPGVYVAESNRTLAAYSLSGATTAPACMMSSVPSNVRNRLNEPPVPPQASLPSSVVPVTRTIRDLTPVPPYQVTSTVSVPRTLPPC